MVCLGNICRSPLAQGILEHKTAQNGLQWMIDSAGTGSWHQGEPPDPRSIAVAKKNLIDISGQRARQITATDFSNFDLIFAMDQSNRQNLLQLAPDNHSKKKIRLIMEELHRKRNKDVPDPYWDKEDGFELVFQMLDEAIGQFVEKYLNHAKV